MELSELEMGSKLELELFDNNGVRDEKTLISEYEWMVDDNSAAIAVPISERRIIPVPAGSLMNIYFIKQADSAANLYKFRAVVKARYNEDKLKILLVEKQGEIVRVQRRNHYRLDTLLEVGYRAVGTVRDGYPGEKQFIKALGVNLSGGGICLLLDDELEAGDLIECLMTFDGIRNIRFFGKIVRFEESDREGRYRYKAGVAYIEIDENDRETVVRYIFQEQRRLLRKGLV